MNIFSRVETLFQSSTIGLIHRHLAAYVEVRPNLLKHAPGYPTVEQLLAVTTTGQTNYGMAFVGAGKSSAGSHRIIEAADKMIRVLCGFPSGAAQTRWRRR